MTRYPAMAVFVSMRSKGLNETKPGGKENKGVRATGIGESKSSLVFKEPKELVQLTRTQKVIVAWIK